MTPLIFLCFLLLVLLQLFPVWVVVLAITLNVTGVLVSRRNRRNNLRRKGASR